MNASFARITLLVALGACSFAAVAQSSVGVGVSVGTGTSEAVAEERINAADEPATHPFCLRETGSHVKLNNRTRDRAESEEQTRCMPASGRVYTQRDLRDTGAIDLADALRRAHPAIR